MARITKAQESWAVKLYKNNFSAPAVAKKLQLSISQVYDALERKGIARRSQADQNHIRFVNSPLSFHFRKYLSLQHNNLLIAAVMLYYGEGTKTGKTVEFVNSDPGALKLFLKFLREVCRVDERRLRFYLYCFSDQDPRSLVNYWGEHLKVSPGSFTKPYIRNAIGKGRRTMSKGVLHIRYSDKRLLEKILESSNQIIKNLV